MVILSVKDARSNIEHLLRTETASYRRGAAFLF
jgi:hypothetical protein